MNPSHTEAINEFLALLRLRDQLRPYIGDVEVEARGGVVTLHGGCVGTGDVLVLPDIAAARTYITGAAAGAKFYPSQPKEAARPAPDVTVNAYVLDADSPVAEAVSNLLAAVVDPSATKGDRLRAAGDVLNAVNSL